MGRTCTLSRCICAKTPEDIRSELCRLREAFTALRDLERNIHREMTAQFGPQDENARMRRLALQGCIDAAMLSAIDGLDAFGRL
jgi:hypothetical protein